LEIVAEWNGHLAHALRVALRMTGEDFAERLGMSVRAVAKWEADRDRPLSMASQHTLDTALNQAPDDGKARFWQLAELNVSSDDHQRPAPSRPTVLDVAAPAALVSTLHPLQATPEALNWYRVSLRELYSADNTIGPLHLLPAVTMHIRTIEGMLTHASGGLQDELLRIGAGFAEFAGFLFADPVFA
jgi:transcriptional regulator with XRE-family HTH domain